MCLLWFKINIEHSVSLKAPASVPQSALAIAFFLNLPQPLANYSSGGAVQPQEYWLPRRHLQWSKGVRHHGQEVSYRDGSGRGGAVHIELHPPGQLCPDRLP